MKKIEADIIVVGGGIGGMSAALGAAAKGVRVALVERNAFCGGAAAILGHRYICGLYANSSAAPRDTLNPGLSREIVHALRRRSSAYAPMRMGRVWVLPCASKELVGVFLRLLRRAKGIRVINGCQAAARSCLSGRAFIDASGSASFARLNGLACLHTGASLRQLAGYALFVNQVKNSDLLPIHVPYVLAQAGKAGGLPAFARFTTFSAYTQNSGRLLVNCPDTFTAAQAKKAAAAIFGYLRKAVVEFRQARLKGSSICAVARESDRVRGRYILTAEDVLSGRRFDDAVVKGSWPVEFWHQHKGPEYSYLKEGSYYTIPARCLQSPDSGNVFFAGRCISAESRALASTRVMGTCIALGEQAGILARRKIETQ